MNKAETLANKGPCTHVVEELWSQWDGRKKVHCNKTGLATCGQGSMGPLYRCSEHRLNPPGWFSIGDHVLVSYVHSSGPISFAATITGFGELPEPTPSLYAIIKADPNASQKDVHEVAFHYLRKLSLLESIAWASA